MPHVLVRQRFEEFERWRAGFESLGPVRAEAGCRQTAVFRNRQDPHEVLVLFEFEDLERARGHMGSEALREAWHRAGVTDPGSADVLDAVPVARRTVLPAHGGRTWAAQGVGTMGIARSPGWWLQLIGVAHAGVGAVAYRDALAEIAGDGLVASVPDRGDRATAFWFLATAPALWLAGRLLRSAEASDDRGAQRVAGGVLTATGVAGAAAMPVSGFWTVVAVGIAALRRSARRP